VKLAGEDGSTTDLWRNYRIGVAILTAVVGLFAGYIMYVIQLVFAMLAAVIELITMQNMGGSGPSMSTDPTAVTIVIGVIGFVVFGGAGYRYARNGSDSRLLVWIAAICSLPLGVFSIWVLRQTAPGANRSPPNKRVTVAVIAGIVVLLIVFFGPMAVTK
jgi:hypothetical protein